MRRIFLIDFQYWSIFVCNGIFESFLSAREHCQSPFSLRLSARAHGPSRNLSGLMMLFMPTYHMLWFLLVWIQKKNLKHDKEKIGKIFLIKLILLHQMCCITWKSFSFRFLKISLKCFFLLSLLNFNHPKKIFSVYLFSKYDPR